MNTMSCIPDSGNRFKWQWTLQVLNDIGSIMIINFPQLNSPGFIQLNYETSVAE